MKHNEQLGDPSNISISAYKKPGDGHQYSIIVNRNLRISKMRKSPRTMGSSSGDVMCHTTSHTLYGDIGPCDTVPCWMVMTDRSKEQCTQRLGLFHCNYLHIVLRNKTSVEFILKRTLTKLVKK